MSTIQFTPGDAVLWNHVPRGGYSWVCPVKATVVKVGPKRVTIDAHLADGGTRRRVVKAGSLVKAQEGGAK